MTADPSTLLRAKQSETAHLHRIITAQAQTIDELADLLIAAAQAGRIPGLTTVHDVTSGGTW